MPYIQDHLHSDETIVHIAKLHWQPVATRLVGLAFWGGLCLFLFFRAGRLTTRLESLAVDLQANDLALVGLTIPPDTARYIQFVALLLLAIAVIRFVRFATWLASVEYGVTTRRVMAKSGLVRRRTRDDLLSQIDSVRINQGLFGRLFNYGTITLTSAGGGSQSWRQVASPVELLNKIENAAEQRGYGSLGPRAQPATPAPQSPPAGQASPARQPTKADEAKLAPVKPEPTPKKPSSAPAPESPKQPESRGKPTP
ncbi:MAG: PH domain-containing protein [Phycisphaerales bacterium]